jgi:PAS domain S-box-containing protein
VLARWDGDEASDTLVMYSGAHCEHCYGGITAMLTRTVNDSPALGIERLDVRVAVVAASAVLYALVFLPLYGRAGGGRFALGCARGGRALAFRPACWHARGCDLVSFKYVLLGVEETADVNAVVWGGAVAGSASLLVGTVAGTLRDVSERLHEQLASKLATEQGLVNSEERLRHLVENAPGVLITVTGDGTVLYSNQSIGGVDSISVRGASVYNFVPRRHQDLFRMSLERVFRTGQPDGYHIAEAVDDTSTLHVIRFDPIRENGQVVAATP